MCERLVHLNIATMKVTDYGLEVIANTLMYLVTVNLFGIKSITGDGIAYLCQKQPHMLSLNLRGGGDPLISYEVGQKLKTMCKARECEVLTGKEKVRSEVRSAPERRTETIAGYSNLFNTSSLARCCSGKRYIRV